MISQLEKQLEDSCSLNDAPEKKVGAIEDALNAAAQIPVDAKTRQTAVVKLRKLKAEINLKNLMDTVTASMKTGTTIEIGVDTRLEDMEHFLRAIDNARVQNSSCHHQNIDNYIYLSFRNASFNFINQSSIRLQVQICF